MSLELVQNFGYVEKQGPPRPGLRRFGVPVGGAFDQESFHLANLLVGNSPTSLCWELGMAQATFHALEPGVVSVVGAHCQVRSESNVFESGSVFSVVQGQHITVEVPYSGARVYVSSSDRVAEAGWRRDLASVPTSVRLRNVLRCVAGPQSDRFDITILERRFSAGRLSNRVGIRLQESTGRHAIELPSEPQCVGAIQVSNDGSLILIGPDGPTIGGYPKIGVVITPDLSRIGQLSPDDEVTFELCSIDEARQLAREIAENHWKMHRILELGLQT